MKSKLEGMKEIVAAFDALQLGAPAQVWDRRAGSVIGIFRGVFWCVMTFILWSIWMQTDHFFSGGMSIGKDAFASVVAAITCYHCLKGLCVPLPASAVAREKIMERISVLEIAGRALSIARSGQKNRK